MMLAEQAVAKKIQESYMQFVNEGNNPEQFNPEQAVDIEAFIKEFNENFIDDISAQGQDLINVIDDLTDALLYTLELILNLLLLELVIHIEML